MMRTIGKWSYLIGLLAVIVAALFGFSAEWFGLVVIILAVLAGLFLANTDELTNYGVRYLTLFAVSLALDAFPFLGTYVTTIVDAMLGFFGPILLTVLLVFQFKQAYDLITEE